MESDCSFKHINFGNCKLEWIAGRSVHWVDVGKGPVVVLVHGGQAWAYAWRYQIEPLAAAGYRIIAPDLPGSGYSDVSSSADYSISALSHSLGDLLDHLKIPQAVFAASSEGGFPYSISPSAAQSESPGWFWLRPAACLTICLSCGG